MKHFRKPLLLSLLAASLSIGGMVNARADALSQSILIIDNFRLLDSKGNPFKNTDFSLLTGTNSALEAAGLNGVFDNKSQNVNILSGPNIPGRACVGTCAPPPFPFVRFPNPPGVPGTFGDADSSIEGNAIDVVDPATPAGVKAQTRADASLATNGTSNNTANVGTSTRFMFKLANPDTMTADFFGTPFLQAYLSAGSGASDQAIATMNWSITIRDLTTATTKLFYSPGEINLGRSVDFAPGLDYYDPGKLPFNATSLMLNNTDTYQLTISQTSFASANVVHVPEPATLSIFGLGLMGMFALKRRRTS